MTPEEIAAIIEAHKFPTLHAGETGINVITLQIWLRMLGFYQGPITGLLDASTAQAVDAFRAQQQAAGIALQAPAGAVLERDTWQAMDNLLQQRLPPDPDALDRLPLPRRASYDSDEKYQKALYEGLRVFGFPIEPAAAPIRIAIAVDASGLGAIHGVPPGSYELELDRVGKPAEGTAELHLEDGDGVPLQGHLRLIHGNVECSVTVVSGEARVSGLAPGEYEAILDRVDATTRILEDTGSLEIHLVDADNKPIGGSGYLMGEIGQATSIQQAVKLFKALHRGLDSGLGPDDRSGLGSNVLTGTFDDTAYPHHVRAWQSFTRTWGRFYGAPWAGIVFHPEPTSQGSVPGELNWGTFQTIRMLQQWGAAYLQASTDEQDVLDRLQRPIAVRYIARPLGGQIDRRNDFSQTGTEASLHLQRLSPQVVAGIPIGQYYGGIDYRSSEYSSEWMQRQLTVLVSLDPNFHALTPDDRLIERQVAPELTPFVTNLTNDRFPASKSGNTSVFDLFDGFGEQRARKLKRDELMIAARKAGGDPLAKTLDTADKFFFNGDQLKQIRTWIDQSGGGPFNSVAWEHFRSVQKALWWCRLLVAAGQFDKVREWSDLYRAIGWEGGLFNDYANISSRNVPPNLRFSFDDDDWKNPLQLESLVEFYINYNDPNRPAETFRAGQRPEGISEPRLPTLTTGSSYQANGVTGGLSSGLHFVLIDGFGARNNAKGQSVTRTRETLQKVTDNQFSVKLSTAEANKLDTDLRKHPEKYVLWLPGDATRASASYRITSTTVSGNTYTLSLDGKPSVGNNASWQILQSSSWLAGNNATSTGNRVTLDANLSQINPNLDTIYLSTDVARPARVYRIISVDGANTVVLDGQPALVGDSSAWRIPAGVGGVLPPLSYDLRTDLEHGGSPLTNGQDATSTDFVTGYDHYDGLLLIVYHGTIEGRFRFTSYTSHTGRAPDSASIRGNKSYDIYSAPAGSLNTDGGIATINFAFKVSEDQTLERDGSRYYYAQTVGVNDGLLFQNVKRAPGGTFNIFIHFGYAVNDSIAPGSGSAGCQVSPLFNGLRRRVLELWGISGVAPYSDIYSSGHTGNKQRYLDARNHLPGALDRLKNLKRKWNEKIKGKLWLIRPDERPLADYSVLDLPPT
jgi:hypothetical protein